MQAEDFWFEVQRHPPTTLSDPRFSGHYVQGSWVITGERRPFNSIKGSFRNPEPAAPIGRAGVAGAFELAARHSKMNLNYHAGSAGLAAPPDSVRGGDQRILSVGLNWFPTAKMELMLDFMHVWVDRLNPASPADPQPFGPPPDTPLVGVQIGQTMNMLALRAQYIF